MGGNIWKVYLQPFDDSGEYSGQWQEVTEDVDFDNVGEIAFQLDNTDYDIGIYRNSSINLVLRNEHGRYSDVDTSQTIFRFTRSGTLCKITWRGSDAPVCGFAVCGEAMLAPETTIFEGLLNDDNLSMNLDDQMVTFTVLGRESIFANSKVPFSDLTVGDLLSVLIYKCLNQVLITRILTVVQLNITCGIDQTVDVISSLENQTVEEALNNLLLCSNSVLYIANDTIFVSPRTPTAATIFQFYGQASDNPENIQAVEAVKSGLARVFNFITWANTTLSAEDTDSVERYGIKKKELSFDFFTGDTKKQNVLDSLLTEFSVQKQEFDLYSKLLYRTYVVDLLNKVTIDYPTIPVPGNDAFPICGIVLCGHSIMPRVLWSFNIIPTDHYKIMGRSFQVKDGTIKYHMRLV